MALFSFKGRKNEPIPFDPEKEEPVVRCGICTGEQTAGFRDKTSGHFREVMLVKTPKDLEDFKRGCGVEDCKKIF